MYYVEIALLLVGAAVLAVGYRKNQRNVLLTGAIVLFLSCALPEAVDGFSEGYRQVRH